ncbi:MAG TPA: DUF1178 family protein [Azospirillaceae bacterium]|nr:DUF1178 family protein [Azospirillaceae bacterium]
MILYELRCASEHSFEAWFRNGETADRQLAEGAMTCPVCGDAKVAKAPMAPRIARSRDGGDAKAEKQAELMRGLRELRRKVEADCDYVGDRFAEEARRIHYGEVETRAIYGETTSDEAAELSEEGIPFARIPWVPEHNS